MYYAGFPAETFLKDLSINQSKTEFVQIIKEKFNIDVKEGSVHFISDTSYSG